MTTTSRSSPPQAVHVLHFLRYRGRSHRPQRVMLSSRCCRVRCVMMGLRLPVLVHVFDLGWMVWIDNLLCSQLAHTLQPHIRKAMRALTRHRPSEPIAAFADYLLGRVSTPPGHSDPQLSVPFKHPAP